MDPTTSILTLSKTLEQGQGLAFAALAEAAYDQVRNMARHQMARRFGHGLGGLTLQPTALANEVMIDLLNQRTQWQNKDQFFALATRMMMRLLVDYQRQRHAKKRGGGAARIGLDQARPEDLAAGRSPPPPAEELAPVQHAIEKLSGLYPRKAEVMTLHLVCDMPLPRVAELLEISLATAERDWQFARAWLAKELGPDGPGPAQ